MTNDAEIFIVDIVSVPPCRAKISDLPVGFRARLVDNKCICKAVEGT